MQPNAITPSGHWYFREFFFSSRERGRKLIQTLVAGGRKAASGHAYQIRSFAAWCLLLFNST